MSRFCTATLGLTMLLATGACQDAPPAPLLSQDPASTASAAQFRAADQSLRVVARALALALADADLRLALRDAMRDSPWDVHQVSFQELTATEAGEGLLSRTAAAAGETPAAFRARLAVLPDLALYMPSREQRRSWRGDAELVVTAGLELERSASYSFGPDGRPVTAGSRPDLGSSASTYAEGRDQYGWRMPGQSVGGWSTDHPWLATAASSGSTTATIQGVSEGSTVTRASIGAISGSASVHVVSPWQNCDPNLDPLCPA
jgi:hypothetical protein